MKLFVAHECSKYYKVHCWVNENDIESSSSSSYHSFFRNVGSVVASLVVKTYTWE